MFWLLPFLSKPAKDLNFVFANVFEHFRRPLKSYRTYRTKQNPLIQGRVKGLSGFPRPFHLDASSFKSKRQCVCVSWAEVLAILSVLKNLVPHDCYYLLLCDDWPGRCPRLSQARLYTNTIKLYAEFCRDN